jgi:hypothetical protein
MFGQELVNISIRIRVYKTFLQIANNIPYNNHTINEYTSFLSVFCYAVDQYSEKEYDCDPPAIFKELMLYYEDHNLSDVYRNPELLDFKKSVETEISKLNTKYEALKKLDDQSIVQQNAPPVAQQNSPMVHAKKCIIL